MVVPVPADLKFSDSFYLLFGAATLMDDIVVWQRAPWYLKPLTVAANLFPSMGKALMKNQLYNALQGRTKASVQYADINHILEHDFLTAHRKALGNKQVDTIFLGASNGGSLHLADVMRVPILGSGLNIFVAKESDPDDVHAFLTFGGEIADSFLQANPQVEVVIHLDPIHDRTNLRKVFHFRVKFWLPQAYQSFIKSHLKPHGTLVVFDVQEPWLHYQLDDRFYYQAGGLNDITPEEYITGSDRIDEWLSTIGASHRGGWGIDGYRPSYRYDDEFGNSPQMVTETRAFAEQEGYNFIHLHATRSHDLSALSTFLIHQAMRDAHVQPRGVMVEQYTQCVPLAVRRLALLPLWTYFVLRTSFNDTQRMLTTVFQEYLREAEELLFLPTQPGNTSPRGDFVPLNEWIQLFQQFPISSVSTLTSKNLYPIDVASLITGPLDVLQRCQGKSDLPLTISLADLEYGAQKMLG